MSPIGGPETSFLLNPNALGLRSQQISWVKVTEAWEGWLPPLSPLQFSATPLAALYMNFYTFELN